MKRNIRLMASCVIAAALAAAIIGSGSEARAASAPWRITSTSFPTIFTRGASASVGAISSATPQITTDVENSSGSRSSGAITIVETLPEGLDTVAGDKPGLLFENAQEIVVEEECNVTGLRIECEIGSPIIAGGVIQLYVPLAVSSTAPEEVVAAVTVKEAGVTVGQTTISAETASSEGAPPFGPIKGPHALLGEALDESGDAVDQAAAHPKELRFETNFNTKSIPGAPVGNNIFGAEALQNLQFELPFGLVLNPQAAPTCSESQLVSTNEGKGCPPDSQVGIIRVKGWLNASTVIGLSLYNMKPPTGVPAEFGFILASSTQHIRGGLSGGFRLVGGSSDLIDKVHISGVELSLWGSPSAESHDEERRGPGCRRGDPGFEGRCPVTRNSVPFVTMPTSCGQILGFEAIMSSWESPNQVEREANLASSSGQAIELGGCQSLAFSPKLTLAATTANASSPSGLDVGISLPQEAVFAGLSPANLKRVSIELPDGMSVNPGAAEGLGACAPSQIGLGNSLPATCPDSSKVGTVEISTPLLRNSLMGAIYLAEQKNNPFGTLLGLYLVAEGEGVVVKLPGRVDTNPQTGTVTTTFDNNPDLPFGSLTVHLTAGPRAALTTPAQCGSYEARTELNSWASTSPVVVKTPISVTQGCGNGKFSPKLEAGTVNPVAGRYSPFMLRVTRQDGEQNLSRISATLPGGLLAKLAGVPLCPESETSSGDCPAASQVGSTTTGIGVGTQPIYIPQAGKPPTAIYLAGPYRGAPYSLVVKVPAQAGPFDLGTIAVRVALNVDPFTAQVTASSDPLPQILEGIPVSYRDVRVEVDRPEFVVNPTSCEPKQITYTLISSGGAEATPTSRFQAASCEGLAFKPSLKLSLSGSTTRTGHPALKAVVTYPKKGTFANIARAQVNLPHSVFLDQGNLNKTCTRPVLLEGKCPKSSIYGKAKAWTPLLEMPLQGPVYLVGGFGYKLPALVADLNGQLRVLLEGKVDSGPNKGIRDTFEAVPDAAVSRFVLEMKGGKKYGLLENSEPLCQAPQRALARFTAQNGRVEQAKPRIATGCRTRNKAGKKNK